MCNVYDSWCARTQFALTKFASHQPRGKIFEVMQCATLLIFVFFLVWKKDFEIGLQIIWSSSITSYALIDLFRPSLTVPSKVFQVASVHLVYNSALFLPSCCCSLLLLVAANLICIFLVSRTWIYFQLLQTFFIPLWSKWCTRLVFWKVSSRLMPIIFIINTEVPNFAAI